MQKKNQCSLLIFLGVYKTEPVNFHLMCQIYPTEQRYNSLQHVFGDRWDGSQLALGQDLNNWRGADLYNLSCKDQTDFMTYKEAQYDIRRQRVKSLCKQIKGFPRNKEIYHEMTRLRAFLFKYSQRDKVAYCHIAKV